MVYFMHNFILILFTIINFCSYSLTLWLVPPFSDPPPPPAEERKTCEHWMFHDGFCDYTETNKVLAAKREKKIDRVVHLYSVMYAHMLVWFPKLNEIWHNFRPWEYCGTIGQKEGTYTYKQFESSRRTCESWIFMNGFKILESEDFKDVNYRQAKDRKISEDPHVSLWAAGYAQFITSHPAKKYVSVGQYCIGMGIVGVMNFMSFKATHKYCADWIILSEYDEINVDANLKKAQDYVKRNEAFRESINHWTGLYIDHLICNAPPKNTLLSKIACSAESSSRSSGKRRLKTPQQFCDSNGFTYIGLVYYTGERVPPQ